MNRDAKKKIKILLIDTDQEYVERTRKTLTREGYRVLSTDQGPSALEMFKSERFQIILMDLNHAANKDMALLNDLRRTDDDVIVIGMTSSPHLDEATNALRAGVFDYRNKSVDGDELLELIMMAIQQKGLVVDFEKKINLEIGRKMRMLRRERGLTLKQLANRTGLSISLISQIERAKSSSSVSTLFKVASALSVKLEHFFLGL